MDPARVDLLWIPLGAGTGSGPRVVRASGATYEAALALTQRRPRRPLFHSALEVDTTQGSFVIEVTPIPDARADRRGVTGTGAVGSRFAGHLRVFRYEVRCWPGGEIPDAGHAVERVHVTTDPSVAADVVALVPAVPLATWGRDEQRAGEMWNSNSVVAWALERAGIDTETIAVPMQGRAPGWDAGRVVARRGPVVARRPPPP